jgi:spore maturation protein SpmA
VAGGSTPICLGQIVFSICLFYRIFRSSKTQETMALNIVWIAFFVLGFLVALYKLIVTGDFDIFKKLVEGIFDSAKSSVMDVAFPLTGVMVFFMGLLNIGEKAGAVNFLARLLNPIMRRLFPEVPSGHPAHGHMVMNFSANMLGLDNAATPFGIKSMESLQSLNPHKETASNAQIMFLVLHTSGLTLLPLSIIAYRASSGSKDAMSVFIPLVLATVVATVASIVVTGLYQRLKFDWVLATWLIGILAAVVWFMNLVSIFPSETQEINRLLAANPGTDVSNVKALYQSGQISFWTKDNFGKIFGNLVLMLIIVTFIVGGLIKKVNIFDAFIEGAKGGFDVILKIIPYLVAMLVGIKVFRESGAFEMLMNGISALFNAISIGGEYVQSLPVAIMRPFSGAGSRGLMLDIFKTYGADSFVGKMASTFMGSADTTFYILALYFGSVGIKKVRYAIWAGMLADLIGVIAAIFIGYVFYKG